MFCNKCGAMVEDGTKFCPSCGQSLAQSAPEQPVYQQPTYQEPVYQQPTYQQPTAPAINTTPILVMGILSICFACTFYFSFLGIIFGAIGKGKVKSYLAAGGTLSGKAKVGSILSTVGLILGIVMTVIAFIVLIALIAGGGSYYSYYY